jgi:hypothetical protein
MLQRISPDWAGSPAIVAASGPSLTPDVVLACQGAQRDGWKVLLVQDAYRAMPFADAMYGCNPSWWRHHKDCGGFAGVKWTTHHKDITNNKLDPDHELKPPQSLADAYGLTVVAGDEAPGFSFDPGKVHYGSNSGYQAINLAILLGSKRIVLVGYDMRCVGGIGHFFGNHPGGELRQNSDAEYAGFIRFFDIAAKLMPKDISIVNATPGSALNSFPKVSLVEALSICGSPVRGM